MTLKDIAVFKHFIASKDLRKPFINVYNGSKGFANNPKEIEDYFSNVEPLAVILSAAKVCPPNATYGYDFWQDVHQDWKVQYKKMQSSSFYQTLEGLDSLTGYFRILRENWNDAKKPWIYEQEEVARMRLGFAPKEVIEEDLDGPAFDIGDKIKGKLTKDIVTIIELKDKGYRVSDGGFIEYGKEDMWELVEESENDNNLIAFTDNDTDTTDDEFDIDFVEIDAKRHRKRFTLQKGILSVNTRNHSGRISINRPDSKEIIDKGVRYVRTGATKNGDIMLMFCNNEKGIPFVSNNDGYCNINSNQFVETFNHLLENSADLAYFCMEKVSNKIDSITYKITKQ